MKYIKGGTVEYIYGGTVKSIEGGTVKYIKGGTVGYSYGTMPSKITGNPTVIAYNSLSKEILKSSQAVIVDRSKDKVVCYIGK